MYLVTGGSGFCGFEIVKFLVGKGEKVRVLDIEPLPERLLGVEFIKTDVRDKKKVFEAVKDIDIVIHTIAKVPISKAGREFWEVNVDGTRNLLEACLKNKVKKIVHLSSSAVQFTNKNPVDEYDSYNPVGDYAKSKLDGELLCKKYIKRGLDIDIIRPRTVLGKGRLGIFDIFFEWISEGKNIYLIGKGTNKIQFIDAEDLASCCYFSSLNKGPHIFNIGSKSFGSLREDLGYLLKYANTGSKIVLLPVSATVMTLKLLDFFHLSPLASWHYLTFHKDFYFTNKRAKEILKWEPKYSNKEMLVSSYDNYIKNKKNRKYNYGTSHRMPLKQGILKLVKIFS